MTAPFPTALVTGAGSGIGRATAVLLSENGYRLALGGRRPDALRATAGLLKAESLILPTDIADPAGAAAMIDAAVSRFGRLDALINNAGLAPRLPIDRHTPEIIDAVYRTNALGPAYAIARAWPIFVRQNSGCIVNISTLGTIDPFPGFFAYAAAKSAVNLMAKSCAVEGRDHNIRAFAIAPGAVDTEMFESNFPDFPRSRRLRPESIAQIILECLRGDRDAHNGNTTLVPSPGS